MKETKMSSKSLVEKAVAVSHLMEISTALGGAAEVADDGEVFLTTSGRSRIRLGSSISDAVSSSASLAGGLGSPKPRVCG